MENRRALITAARVRRLVLLLATIYLALTALAVSAGFPMAAGFRFQNTDGRIIRLEDFRGKWVVVNFWAPWCPLCWTEVPALNALSMRRDFAVIGVAMDYGPDVPAVRAAIQQQGMRYQAQVLGGDRVSADAFYRQVGPVNFYPTSYLYSPDGVRRGRIVGPINSGRFQPISRDEGASSFGARISRIVAPGGAAAGTVYRAAVRGRS
jgi:thiol-disulfide isomerase/thioredoxin